MDSFLVYKIIKSLHIISVISWMVGMLYLPRLFVYHTQATKKSETSETFKIMEKKLLKFIMNPAMILSYFFAIILIIQFPEYYKNAGWLHTKILLVLILSALHGYFAVTVKKFATDQNIKTAKFYKIINEIPTILMILIVVLVVVRPF